MADAFKLPTRLVATRLGSPLVGLLLTMALIREALNLCSQMPALPYHGINSN